MRRFVKLFQVKRHGLYVVVQDGEAGNFGIIRWDATAGSRPRPVGRLYPYRLGDEEDKAKARSKAYAVAGAMSEEAARWLDNAHSDSGLSLTLMEAERDFRAKAAADATTGEVPLSIEEAVRLDREAASAAHRLTAGEQEAARVEALRQPASGRRR